MCDDSQEIPFMVICHAVQSAWAVDSFVQDSELD
jgi:hypothetical protein